jgi:urease accessory protein
MPTDPASERLLFLLQLVSPTLPVGAYSYSEGLELLVERGILDSQPALEHWLVQELTYGAVRVEAAVMVRAYRAAQGEDWQTIETWNHWLSAARETEELRQQSWQMGSSLTRLLQDLQPQLQRGVNACGRPCNFAIAFALAAAHWQIPLETATLGYLYSWATNLVSAGVRLVPLGQTQGQQLLLQLQPALSQAADAVLYLADDDLMSCSWGLSLASMAHETQYSRLFRS